MVPRCSSCYFSILAMKPGFFCVWIFLVFHGRSCSWTFGERPVYRNTIMREKFVSRRGGLSVRVWEFAAKWVETLETPVGCWVFQGPCLQPWR